MAVTDIPIWQAAPVFSPAYFYLFLTIIMETCPLRPPEMGFGPRA
jgi:hypothetical protein